MAKRFSFLKDMTTHQRESKEGENSTTFQHYVGGLGADVKQTTCIRSEDNYAKQAAKSKHY